VSVFAQGSVWQDFSELGKEFYSSALEILGLAICVTCSYISTFEYSEDPMRPVRMKGIKSECALLELALKLGLDPVDIRATQEEKDFAAKPYSSNENRCTILCFKQHFMLLAKGSIEFVMPKSKFILGRYRPDLLHETYRPAGQSSPPSIRIAVRQCSPPYTRL
jgi:hypothetical protein